MHRRFRLLAFVTNFCLALENVLSANLALRTFLAACVFLINFVLVGILWPYKVRDGVLGFARYLQPVVRSQKTYANVTSLAAGFGNLLQILILLDYSSGNKRSYFLAVLIISLIASTLAALACSG